MDDADLVTDPAYAALVETLELARRHQPLVAGALEPALAIMVRGDAWRGTGAARDFLDDLGDRHRELVDIAKRLVEDVRDALASTPEGVAEDMPGHAPGDRAWSMR